MKECNLGNLITDAWVEHFVAFSSDKEVEREDPSFQSSSSSSDTNREKGWTRFPLALVNSGTIRGTIDEQQRGGNVTLEDIITVMPFGNRIEVVHLTGRQLQEALEHGISAYQEDSSRLEGRFLQMSGLRASFDLSQPPGKRLSSVSVRCGKSCRVPRFEALRKDELYPVLVTDYMAGGGDGFTVLAQAAALKRENLDQLDTEIIRGYFKRHSPVTLGVEGRITLLRPGRYNEGEDADGGSSSASASGGSRKASLRRISSFFGLSLMLLLSLCTAFALP